MPSLEGTIVRAAVQDTYAGIDAIHMRTVPDPSAGLTGTLIRGAYAPVISWDLRSEGGTIKDRRLPAIIGYGTAGTVIDAGPLGARRSIGKRVVSAAPAGSNAQIAVAPLAPFVFAIPDGVSLVDAATLIGGGDAALMLVNTSGVVSGDRVLVMGATGGVGTYVVQLLHLRAITPDILSSTRGIDIAAELFPGDAVLTEMDLLGAHYDVIIDLTADRRLLERAERALRPGGMLLMAGTPDYVPTRRDITPVFRNHPISPRDYVRLLQYLAEKKLHAVVDSVYPLERIQEAQRHVQTGPHHGRTLLELNPTASEGSERPA